jgi:tetratricopeptide (TPR) repeat protein
LAACGQFYAAQKRWPESFQALNAAIAAAPKQAVYKHQLAVAKTRSGDIDGGVALFTELIGPDKARYNVAFLLRQQGQSAAAAQQCRMALALNPQFEPARTLLTQIQNPQLAQAVAARNMRQPPGALAVSQRPSMQADYSETANGVGAARPAVQSADGMDQSPWPSSPPVPSNSSPAGSDATFMPGSPQSAAPGVLQQPISTQPSATGQPRDPFRGYSGNAGL